MRLVKAESNFLCCFIHFAGPSDVKSQDTIKQIAKDAARYFRQKLSPIVVVDAAEYIHTIPYVTTCRHVHMCVYT